MKKHLCECKAVTFSEIRFAVRKKGASTLLDIQNITKASTGCGRCRLAVEDIIANELKNRLQLKLKLDF